MFWRPETFSASWDMSYDYRTVPEREILTVKSFRGLCFKVRYPNAPVIWIFAEFFIVGLGA